MSTYFTVLAGAIILPFLLSFDKKVAFYKRWKYIFPAMILTGILFIVWDVYFTRHGIWGFSPEHLAGLHVLSLPVEEWLFFLVIPYASVFTFDVIKAYFPGIKATRTAEVMNYFLIAISIMAVIVFHGRAYTMATFSLMALLLAIHQGVLKSAWMSKFYVSYALVLMPFVIVNGLLTGTAISGEVVWYNDAENMGIRMGTIPLEDVFYGFDLVLMNVTLYQLFQRSQFPRQFS